MKKYLVILFCFITLFQINITVKAQAKVDTFDRIKLYVDSVKSKKADMVVGLHAYYWKKRPNESASYEQPLGYPDSNGYLKETIIIETIAWFKKQRIDRTYIYENNKLCYYSEKRTKSSEEFMESPPWLEVYFYDGKILGYSTDKRFKKLSEKDIKKIIKKGGYVYGIDQIGVHFVQ